MLQFQIYRLNYIYMQEAMGGEDLRNALNALGDRLRARTDIVVGGAGALILTGELLRATSDFDVLFSDPDIGRLQEDIFVQWRTDWSSPPDG